jgi:hypothetical protein
MVYVRCVSTVLTEMKSFPPISWFVCPSASRWRTRRSRSESGRDAPDCVDQLGVGCSFGNVAVRARGDRLPHRCGPGLRRHDENSTFRGNSQDLGDCLVAARTRQEQVDQDVIGLQDACSCVRLLGGSGFADRRDSLFLLEPHAQRGAEDRVIVDEEDADHASAPAATITARVPRTARGLSSSTPPHRSTTRRPSRSPSWAPVALAVCRAEPDAVVVDDEYASSSASQSGDVNLHRAGRNRVCKQLGEFGSRPRRGPSSRRSRGRRLCPRALRARSPTPPR